MDTPRVTSTNDSGRESTIEGSQPMRSLPSFWLIVAAFVLAQGAAPHAQDTSPTPPIQLVVTVPPGGAADNIARVIGAKLSDALGQQVVINNRGGGGGTPAAPQGAEPA